MKRVFIYIVLAFFTFSIEGIAQESSSIISAFEKSNSVLLVNQLSDQVEYVFKTEGKSCNKTEFVSTLNQFLKSNSVNEFKIIHEGSRADSKFMIFSLSAVTGKYRVHIFFRKMNNKYLINQVRIEPTNE